MKELILGGIRSGKSRLTELRARKSALDVVYISFGPKGDIPAAFACRGAAPSPDVEWTNVPADAMSLVLLTVDFDAPSAVQLYALDPLQHSEGPAGHSCRRHEREASSEQHIIVYGELVGRFGH